MTSRRLRPARLLRWVAITAALAVLMPGTVFATHFELSRLASQIQLISGQLAHELRYTRHYGPVRQRAVTLSRDASQLVETLQRNRSNSRVRSRFKDVRRGYERLEQAFFSADRRAHDPDLYREISLLSDVFTNLSDEFYYAGFGEQTYGSPYIARNRNRGSIIVGTRYFGGSNYYRGNRGTHPSGHIVPHREREIPPVFRGNSGRVTPDREHNRGQDGRGRIERGSRNTQSAPTFDHRSPVLERQGRREVERRELERQARPNRHPAAGRQSSRGNRGEQNRGGRGVVSETDSLNHYE